MASAGPPPARETEPGGGEGSWEPRAGMTETGDQLTVPQSPPPSAGTQRDDSRLGLRSRLAEFQVGERGSGFTSSPFPAPLGSSRDGEATPSRRGGKTFAE